MTMSKRNKDILYNVCTIKGRGNGNHMKILNGIDTVNAFLVLLSHSIQYYDYRNYLATWESYVGAFVNHNLSWE